MLFRPQAQLTLRSFVPRRTNMHARAAGIAFIRAQHSAPDALILAGRPGTGKTHLLNALANWAKAEESYGRVVCMTARQFVDEVARGHFYRDLDRVLDRLAEAALFALDDVDQLTAQNKAASAFLELMRRRRFGSGRTVLSASLGLGSASEHPLVAYLDDQPAVRLN